MRAPKETYRINDTIDQYNKEVKRYRDISRKWELLKDQNSPQGHALLNRIAEKQRLLLKLKSEIPANRFKSNA